MAHRSQEEIEALLSEARSKVKQEGIYAHYKNPENTYRVVGIAIREEDEEPVVVYEPLYEGRKNTWWTRPVSSWCQEVVNASNEKVLRFTPVE